jgi:hypothetical protein
MESRPFVVAGDLHGDIGWGLRLVRAAAAAGASRIFQVGDLAARWPGREKFKLELRMDRLLASCAMDFVYIDGNHDPHQELRRIPVDADGLARVRENVLYLPRAGRLEFAGLRWGGLGGACSVDQHYRTEGKDWWLEEEITQEDVDELVAGGSLDILLTHDVPMNFRGLKGDFDDLPEEILQRADAGRRLLQDAVDRLRPVQVFSGHWHQRRVDVLEHPDGSTTRVDVLDMNGSATGNAVFVWPEVPLRIEPLIVRG